MPCINVYPTNASVVYKNGNHKASYAMKNFGIEYQEFLLRFCTHRNNLIAFLGPSNCVNTQYAALSGAMTLFVKVKKIFQQKSTIFLWKF